MVCLVVRERLVTMVLRVMLVLQELQEQQVPLDLRCDYLLYHLSSGTTGTIFFRLLPTASPELVI